MSHVAITLCTWKRPALLHATLTCLSQLDTDGHRVSIVVCGSEGEATREVATEFGATYVHHKNAPLSDKFNAQLAAARELDPDYVIQWSDSALCGPGTLRQYTPLMNLGIDAAGWRQANYYAGGRIRHFSGYSHGRKDPVGIGRMVSRRALDAVGWKLWEPGLENSLDRSMYEVLGRAGINIQCLDEPFGLNILHVKTASNKNTLEDFRKGEIVTVLEPRHEMVRLGLLAQAAGA